MLGPRSHQYWSLATSLKTLSYRMFGCRVIITMLHYYIWTQTVFSIIHVWSNVTNDISVGSKCTKIICRWGFPRSCWGFTGLPLPQILQLLAILMATSQSLCCLRICKNSNGNKFQCKVLVMNTAIRRPKRTGTVIIRLPVCLYISCILAINNYQQWHHQLHGC